MDTDKINDLLGLGIDDRKQEKQVLDGDDNPKTTDVVPLDGSIGSILAKHAAEAGVPVKSEQLNVLAGFMDRAQYGHQAAMPMKCKAYECPFINMCPLKAAKMPLPLGESCPVERSLIELWVTRTIKSLGIDPNEPEYSVDMDMVYEIAALELMRTRAAHHLAEDPALVTEKIVGYSPHGEPIYDDKPKIPLLILERYGKMITKLREQLLATRKSQAQAGQLAGDMSTRTANIVAKAKKILESRKAGGSAGDIVDAEFRVADAKQEEADKPRGD